MFNPKHAMQCAVIAVMALTVSSCAFFQEHETAARIGVQYATGKVIGDDQEKRLRVIEVASQVRELATGDPQATVTLLMQTTRDLIRWDRLDSTDRRLVQQLLIEIERELRERVGDDLLSEDTRVTVAMVADWVIEAAKFPVPT